MAQPGRAKENYLVTVLAVSTVLGMAVALAVYFSWTSGVIASGFRQPLSVIALVACPPFILSVAVPPVSDSDLALVLVVGTIVFANAALYAGVAAGGYFVVSTMVKHKRMKMGL